MTTLNDRGYKEQFKLTENGVMAISSDHEFKPTELKIVDKYRFDGMTNPSDESTLYSLVSTDGLKGTLVVSGDVHSEEHQAILNEIPSEEENT